MLGILCGGQTWTRSAARSRQPVQRRRPPAAKGAATKSAGKAPPKTRRSEGRTCPAPGKPPTRSATLCLLPDIARTTH